MCHYTQYIFDCKHPASKPFKTKLCDGCHQGYHCESTDHFIVPKSCRKCAEATSQDASLPRDQALTTKKPLHPETIKAKSGSSPITASPSSSSASSASTSIRPMSEVNSNDACDKTWYIDKVVCHDPGFNLDPFNTKIKRRFNKRRRRESEEPASPKSQPLQ